MIAGELPADPALLSPGAGPVDIYNNLIQANLANDDGGGLRFLMAGNFRLQRLQQHHRQQRLDPRGRRHLAQRRAAGAGLQQHHHEEHHHRHGHDQQRLPGAGRPVLARATAPCCRPPCRPARPIFSNPLLFNNIFWDNRAGTWTGGGVSGIGLAGDPNPINYWDLGIADGSGLLTLGYSVFQQNTGQYPVTAGSSNNQQVDPAVVQTYDVTVSVLPWRGNPNFVDVLLVAVQLPPNLMGNYHLATGSPAINTGGGTVTRPTPVAPPTMDYDDQRRPSQGFYEIGADEVGPYITFFPLMIIAGAIP